MKRFFLSALAAALLVPTLVLAQPDPGNTGPRRPAMMRGRMWEQLKLTDDQHDQIRTLSVANQKAQTELFAKIRIARIDLRELFRATSLDRSAIEKQMNVVSDLEQRGKMNRLDHFFAVYKLLTPEQQKTWRNSVGRMGWMDGMGMRGRGRPGIGMLENEMPMGSPDSPIPDQD